MIAGGIAATVIISASVAAGVLWDGGTPAAAQEATTLLLTASHTADGEPQVPVKPGDYIYIHRVGSVVITVGDVTYRQSQVNEMWLPQDRGGSGYIHITDGAVQYLSVDGAQRLATYGVQPPSPGAQRRWTIPPDEIPRESMDNPSYAYLRTLPTDPDQLYSLIRDYAQDRGIARPQQMLRTVAALLSWSVAPPALRSALFEVAARIPGIYSLGSQTDASGRSGTALAVTARGVRSELIFDPLSTQLLGVRAVMIEDPTGRIEPGTVLQDDAITISSVPASNVPK